MTSLTEVYDGGTGEVASPQRLYAGTSLVLLGAALAVVALLMATTPLFGGLATSLTPGVETHYASVRLAGVLAGLGIPSALVGLFLVLPAGRRVQAAAVISVSLCLLGVILFWDAYPYDWRSHGDDHTFRVSAIYLLGLFMAVWSLFTAVVNFKMRNSPGGALEMNVTRHDRTVVEATESNDSSGFGGIGFLGGTPDGEVETQTNAADGETLSYDESSSVSRSGSTSTRGTDDTGSRSRPPTGGAGIPASDGGTAASDISSPLDDGDGYDAESVESPTSASGPTDRYCGNCKHFEYVRSSDGIAPYCGRHGETMADMDACEEWTLNHR